MSTQSYLISLYDVFLGFRKAIFSHVGEKSFSKDKLSSMSEVNTGNEVPELHPNDTKLKYLE